MSSEIDRNDSPKWNDYHWNWSNRRSFRIPTLRLCDSSDATATHARSKTAHFRSAYCQWSTLLIYLEINRWNWNILKIANKLRKYENSAEQREAVTVLCCCYTMCLVLGRHSQGDAQLHMRSILIARLSTRIGKALALYFEIINNDKLSLELIYMWMKVTYCVAVKVTRTIIIVTYCYYAWACHVCACACAQCEKKHADGRSQRGRKVNIETISDNILC